MTKSGKKREFFQMQVIDSDLKNFEKLRKKLGVKHTSEAIRFAVNNTLKELEE